MRFFLALLVLPVAGVFAYCDDSNAHQGRLIKSILAEKCIQCHGPDATKREADLRLDVEVAGDRQLSRLTEVILKRIESDDPDFKMPPPSLGKPLNDRERIQLRQWLASGARLESHWSYQPIQKVRLAN